MNIIDVIWLAIALAMDCFSVSIVSGIISRRWLPWPMFRMSILFGVFQGMMPVIGWVGIAYFSRYLEVADHWIAFGLLTFLGGRMVKEGLENEQESHLDTTSLHTQLMLSVATSIDALAVGISFACLGYTSLSSLTLPVVIIGVVSTLFAIVGHYLGIHFGAAISRRLRPSLFGGIVLIFIGIKILLSHLLS